MICVAVESCVAGVGAMVICVVVDVVVAWLVAKEDGVTKLVVVRTLLGAKMLGVFFSKLLLHAASLW